MEKEVKLMARVKKYLKRESAFKGDRRIEMLEWLPGNCKFGLCGEDAACLPGPNSTHKCVCPSDLSAPTTEEKLCLTRKTVPLTPKPILNINVNGRNTSTAKNISLDLQQVGNMIAEKNQYYPAAFFIGLMSFFLIFAGMIGVVYLFKKKFELKCPLKAERRKTDMQPSAIGLTKGLLGNYVPNPQYIPEDTMPVPILSKETLTFVQEIGEGFFGKVFRGELKKEDGSTQTVAIKVLKESASKQAEEDFMREVEIMSSFRHENILSLIGIVEKESATRPWMIFEFMIHGDLAEVLRSNSKQFWKPLPGMKPLTKESLLKIALQIAGGMKYLASQRFVHNDLACRNCLVGSELTVKIADFGMSRDVYTCDYYRIGGSKPVPLRWMSPESVMYRRFTLESDVWSYGVVLWEIYSFGKQPYYGLNNDEVVKMILQGILLVSPDGCPPFISDLMRACWKLDPKDRIKFPDIYNSLKKVWKETKFENEVTFSESEIGLTCGENSSEIDQISLPRPPIFPVPIFSNIELLDSDNYLAPQAAQLNEYLQPLPD